MNDGIIIRQLYSKDISFIRRIFILDERRVKINIMPYGNLSCKRQILENNYSPK
ncbi:hypothetical protein [Methanobrevibacter sp.]|uniref:hypothetical protein n=1 Tax=Methanobrevibacter sp. TaxID=66852 RepID=UPI00389064C2